VSLGIRPRFSSRLLTHSNEAELIRRRKADIRPNDRVGSVPWGRTGDREVARSPFDGSPVGADRERLRGADETELLQGGHAIVEANFLMIFLSLSFNTVVPVNFILRPVLAGKDPTRKSLNGVPYAFRRLPSGRRRSHLPR